MTVGHRRLARLTAMLVLFANVTTAYGVDDAKDRPSTELQISLVRSRVSAGTKRLRIRVKLRNLMSHPIKVPRSAIASQISITTEPDSTHRDFRSTSISADPLPGGRNRMVTIQPGRFFLTIVGFDVGPDFLTPGKYTVRVTYASQDDAPGSGIVQSNEAIVTVYGTGKS